MGSIQMIMLVIIGAGAIGFAIYSMKKKSGGNQQKINLDNNSETQKIEGLKTPAKSVVKKDMSDFIRFDKIANDMIYQKHGERYTMVIQCKGINYELMSEIEQMAVEEGFITFLNTLKFPIQLYVQTRSIDLNENVRKYKERVKMFEEAEREVSKRYSALEDDIDAELEDVVIAREEKLKYENLLEYVEDITHYVETLAMNKQMLQRNFYVVLSYNKSDLITSEKFSKEEYEDLCYRELYTRAQGVIGSLMACSVTSHILTSNELAELLYISLNKDDEKTLDIRKAIESGFYRLYTTSDDVREKRQKMIEEEIMKESMKRIEESIREAIRTGIIVPEDDMIDALDKEIDKTALKTIDNSRVSDDVKDELKNNITKKRKERLIAKAEEQRIKEEEEKKLELENQNKEDNKEDNALEDTSEDINDVSNTKYTEEQNTSNSNTDDEIIS